LQIDDCRLTEAKTEAEVEVTVKAKVEVEAEVEHETRHEPDLGFSPTPEDDAPPI
jgi:hypothetical protein